MNTETGDVAAMRVLAEELEKHGRGEYVSGLLKPIDPANLTPRVRAQLASSGRTRIGRNSPCPCGSRKRFKRCCMTGKGAAK